MVTNSTRQYHFGQQILLTGVVVQTFRKWVRIVEVVFEPETISELEIAKLSG